MKAKAKKCVVSRKKQTKTTKPKSVSSKKASKSSKNKKPSANSVKPVKQLLRPSTMKGKPRNKTGKGGWKKGVSGNPKGRPKLGNTKLDNLKRTIREVEAEPEGAIDVERNVTKHFVREAFSDNHILSALMKKLYPDLKSIEQITVPGDAMTEKEAADIRKEMAKRFETK